MNRLKKIFRMEFVILGIITGVLIAGAFFLFTLTVRSSDGDDNSIWNEYYAPAESEYISSVRSYLGEIGYSNPGVTLTHVTDSELMRTYTLCIHHRRFEDISTERKEEIITKLEEMGFEDDRCSIFIEFI